MKIYQDTAIIKEIHEINKDLPQNELFGILEVINGNSFHFVISKEKVQSDIVSGSVVAFKGELNIVDAELWDTISFFDNQPPTVILLTELNHLTEVENIFIF